MSESIQDSLFNSPNCQHLEVTNFDGVEFCDLCGLKLDEELVNNEQYGTANNSAVSGNGYTNNPGRCHLRKDTARGLYTDLESRNFPQKIIERANDYYKQIIENKIYRAKNRLGIVFACTFHAYIDFEEPQASVELAKKFDLDRKSVSSGLKTFSEIFRNGRTKKHIGPLDLVPKILGSLGVENGNLVFNDISKIYSYASNKNSVIKISNPQAVCAGLVYYYLKLSKNPITRHEYSKLIGMTEITFIKLANEFCETVGESVKL